MFNMRSSGRDKKEAKAFYQKDIIAAESVKELLYVVKEIREERASLGARFARELEMQAYRKAKIIVDKEEEKRLTEGDS